MFKAIKEKLSGSKKKHHSSEKEKESSPLPEEPKRLSSPLPNTDKMSKHEVVQLLEKYYADYKAYSARISDFLGTAEEKLNMARRISEEQKEIKQHNERIQAQQAHLIEENDKAITANNQLRNAISSLEAELKQEKSDSSISSTLISKLKEDIKRKDKNISEFEKKFDLFEEKLQQEKRKNHTNKKEFEMKETNMIELQKEIEELRQQNNQLQLSTTRENSAIALERTECQKTIKALEANVTQLKTEKASLALRSLGLQERIKCFSVAKTEDACQTDKEYQNDEIEMLIQSRLKQYREEIEKKAQYEETLKKEISILEERLRQSGEKIEELIRKQSEQNTENQNLKENLIIFQKTNGDLQNRRIAGTKEIAKLRAQIIKQSNRYSEAGIRFPESPSKSSNPFQGAPTDTIFLEEILGELEKLYKKVIQRILSDINPDPKASLAEAGEIDFKFNQIIEKVTDFWDEKSTISKKFRLSGSLVH